MVSSSNIHKYTVRVLIISFFCILFVNASSQTYEDIKSQMEEQFNSFRKQNEEKFNKYIEMIDKEYSDYLRQTWEKFDLYAAEKRKKEPKPSVIPECKTTTIGDDDINIEYSPPQVTDVYHLSYPPLPGVKKTETKDFETISKTLNFYGSSLAYSFDKNISMDVPGDVNEGIVSDYWDAISITNYNHLIDQLLNFKKDLNLNDWGYYMLLKKISGQVCPDNKNAGNLLTWFLLTRSRYKAKIAFNGNNVLLMLPSENTFYGKNYFVVDGLKYYLIDGSAENIRTFKKDFPETDIIMDMNLYYPVNLGVNVSHKTIRYKKKNIDLEVRYKKDIIDFFRDYPLADIKIYFDAAVTPEIKESIIENLRPYVKNKPEIDGANFLIDFVQNGFDYKTDQEQFGYEKFYFPEEVFYYPYSDCEDRAVLFAYLVKELLGLEVVGLAYDGHMATAICFNENIEGDYINYKGEKYIVADPTYTGAPVGVLMPEFRKAKPELILLENIQHNKLAKEKVWKLAGDAGCFRGDNKEDVVFDDMGNSYITGYYSGEAVFDDKKLSGSPGEKNVFVAKYDNNGKLVWVSNATGNGNDVGFGIILDNNNDVIISGSFNDDLNLNGKNLQAVGESDVFIAKYDKNGKLLWASKAGVDKLDHSVNFMFAAMFDTEGKKMMAKLYNETENFNNYGLALDDNGNAFITGSFFATTGLNVSNVSFDAGSDFDAAINLKIENDKLLERNYEKTIAGLFAAMELLKINTLEISGKSIKEILEKHNPEFRNFAPGFFDSFGKMTFMKNTGGIITIKIADGKSLIFDKIKINNNARIKIIHYKSGNVQLDVFSGIYVGKKNIWYNMNFVKLYNKTGDLLLDYDEDHTQKKVNLKTDILKRD
jgi:hypothetical protein